MPFYDSKPSPSIPPSYVSKSPTGPSNMPESPYGNNRRTPYEQELDNLGGRGGSNEDPSSGHGEREGWKNGADNYFQHRPAPHPHVAKMYRFFCCGSRGGCAAWVVFILLFIIGLIIGLFFLAHKQASKAALPVQESALPSANTSITTITLTPSHIISATPPPPSTFTTVSISTYSPASPVTVTETTEITTTASEVSTETETQPASTITTILSGTIITTTATATSLDTEISTETDVQTLTTTTTAISISTTTQTQTQPTTLVTTLVTTQVTTQTYTPPEPSTVTVTTINTVNNPDNDQNSPRSTGQVNTITRQTTIYPSTVTLSTTITVRSFRDPFTGVLTSAPPDEITVTVPGQSTVFSVTTVTATTTASASASALSEGAQKSSSGGEKCPHNVGALTC